MGEDPSPGTLPGSGPKGLWGGREGCAALLGHPLPAFREPPFQLKHQGGKTSWTEWNILSTEPWACQGGGGRRRRGIS